MPRVTTHRRADSDHARVAGPVSRLGLLLAAALAAGVVTAALILLAGTGPGGGGGSHFSGELVPSPTGSPSGSVEAVKGGWKVAASAAAGQIRLTVTAPAGQTIPNYCGGPGFAVDYINAVGVVIPARDEPLPQYCLAGSSATQTFTFPVPSQPGRYDLRVTTRSRGPGTGGGPLTIPPTLTILVGAGGRVELG